MNIAIILAAGTGKRVGGDIPKQFINVLGKPILAYTLENFESNPEIDAVEVVCSHEWKSEVNSIVHDYKISKAKWITEGGSTFQESVKNGAFFLKDIVGKEDIAVISFGVSPLTTKEIVNDSIRVAKEHGNGISAEDSPLCLCYKDDEYSTSQNLIRETVKGFSNPWSFRFGELCEVYEEADKRGMLAGMEPHTTSVYLALGKKLWFSKSSGFNFKITLKEDIDKFEALLLLKQKRSENGIAVDW